MNDKYSLKNIIRTYKYIFPRAIKPAPKLVIGSVLMWMIGASAMGLLAYFTQKVFDNAELFLNGEIGIEVVVGSLIIFFSWMILSEIADGFAYYWSWKWLYIATGTLSKELHDKMASISPEKFEDVKFLSELEKSKKGTEGAAWLPWITIWLISMHGTYFLWMTWYLINLEPLLLLAFPTAFIPAFLTQLLRLNIFNKLEEQNAPLRRENEYYYKTMTTPESLREIRGEGAYGFFLGKFLDTLKTLIHRESAALTKSKVLELGVNIIALFANGLVIYIAFSAMMDGRISVGGFVAFFSSLIGIFDRIYSLFHHIANEPGRVVASINYIYLMQYVERGGNEYDLGGNLDISLKNASFTYPNSEKLAVNNISIDIPYGSLVALVGENGSGKTTLIKLITGIFVPTEGEILIGGHATKDSSSKSLFAHTSAAFQKFARYKMTLKDNIEISDKSHSITQETRSLSNEIGLDEKDSVFTHGFETMLSREFGGVELSGGQWQKIALARSLHKKHKILVLDEPTAAIDPIQETKIYKQFAEFSKNKTAFIVTHRLGSARLADIILVMKSGELCEVGNHEELLNRDGEYAKMYRSQSQWYETISLH
ncbi:MAG: ABC transporter ATP-binding protein [Lachnospiraceae bacterium]